MYMLEYQATTLSHGNNLEPNGLHWHRFYNHCIRNNNIALEDQKKPEQEINRALTIWIKQTVITPFIRTIQGNEAPIQKAWFLFGMYYSGIAFKWTLPKER
jgi:hypothetical protein